MRPIHCKKCGKFAGEFCTHLLWNLLQGCGLQMPFKFLCLNSSYVPNRRLSEFGIVLHLSAFIEDCCKRTKLTYRCEGGVLLHFANK